MVKKLDIADVKLKKADPEWNCNACNKKGKIGTKSNIPAVITEHNKNNTCKVYQITVTDDELLPYNVIFNRIPKPTPPPNWVKKVPK